jgi:TerC family integral membrane protein
VVTAHDPWIWIAFSGLVLGLMVLDLGVLNRHSHTLSLKEAGLWSAGLVVLALGFGLFIWNQVGSTPALEYYTGYLIELSLSVDNLFVFLLIFQYFALPSPLQARVLKWGIIGAMVMRGIMIASGALLLARFHWIAYVFGGILIITGIRFYRGSVENRVEPERNPLVQMAKRMLPFSDRYDGDKFFVREAGRRLATPLLLVLLVIEWSDLVFAIDSIPAIFAITRDPLIVYSSNVFAILGLRALFFLLASAIDRFVYLKPAVATILVFVGLKMVGSAWIELSTTLSLAIVLGLLGLGVLASLLKTRERPVTAPR